MKKPRKYHYGFYFRKGNYRDVADTLSDMYPKLFAGSGIFLLNGSYDVGFVCTAVQARNISRYIARNLPKAKMVRTELT
jgi:hypothetical protein